MTTLPACSLLLDSNRGIYIPYHFVNDFDLSVWQGINDDDALLVKLGPDCDAYWDCWDTIISNASYTKNGYTWRLYQDGDLFALCPELMNDDEKANFGFDQD